MQTPAQTNHIRVRVVLIMPQVKQNMFQQGDKFKSAQLLCQTGSKGMPAQIFC